MNGNRTRFLTDGTAAIDLGLSKPSNKHRATIIPFPTCKASQQRFVIENEDCQAKPSVRNALTSILLKSEMYCSLKFEDVRGCRYGMFSPLSIRVLAASGTVIAAASLFFGV